MTQPNENRTVQEALAEASVRLGAFTEQTRTALLLSALVAVLEPDVQRRLVAQLDALEGA